MKVKNIFRVGLGFFLAGVFVWLVVRQVNYHQLVNAFLNVNYSWLILALLFYGLEYGLRISRWKIMLLTQNPALRWLNCSKPLLVSYAVNAVLPFRAGDAVRCFSFNAHLGVGSGAVLATMFVERILDFLVVLMFFGIALVMFNFDSIQFIDVGGGMLIIVCTALLASLLFPQLLSPFVFILRKTISFLVPKHQEKLHQEIDNAVIVLEDLSKNHTMSRLIGYTLALWMMEVGVFLFVANALPAIIHPEAAWLALPVGTLSTLIPSTPGYIGTFDYFVTLSFEVFGNATSASLAYAMIVHVILLAPLMLLGVFYLFSGVKKQII